MCIGADFLGAIERTEMCLVGVAQPKNYSLAEVVITNSLLCFLNN